MAGSIQSVERVVSLELRRLDEGLHLHRLAEVRYKQTHKPETLGSRDVFAAGRTGEDETARGRGIAEDACEDPVSGSVGHRPIGVELLPSHLRRSEDHARGQDGSNAGSFESPDNGVDTPVVLVIERGRSWIGSDRGRAQSA